MTALGRKQRFKLRHYRKAPAKFKISPLVAAVPVAPRVELLEP